MASGNSSFVLWPSHDRSLSSGHSLDGTAVSKITESQELRITTIKPTLGWLMLDPRALAKDRDEHHSSSIERASSTSVPPHAAAQSDRNRGGPGRSAR